MQCFKCWGEGVIQWESIYFVCDECGGKGYLDFFDSVDVLEMGIDEIEGDDCGIC